MCANGSKYVLKRPRSMSRRLRENTNCVSMCVNVALLFTTAVPYNCLNHHAIMHSYHPTPSAPASSSRKSLCVVAQSARLRDAIGRACSDEYDVSFHHLPALSGSQGALEALVSDADAASALLLEWDLLHVSTASQLCSRLHALPAPLIAMCESDEREFAVALAAGADRVHPLPFSKGLLRTQILAHERSRKKGNAPDVATPPEQGPSRIELGEISVDVEAHELRIGGRLVGLTQRQLAVFTLLLRSPSRTLTRDRILREVWGMDFDPGTNIVDVNICYVRQALARHGVSGAIITVRGVGYRFDPTEASATRKAWLDSPPEVCMN